MSQKFIGRVILYAVAVCMAGVGAYAQESNSDLTQESDFTNAQTAVTDPSQILSEEIDIDKSQGFETQVPQQQVPQKNLALPTAQTSKTPAIQASAKKQSNDFNRPCPKPFIEPILISHLMQLL